MTKATQMESRCVRAKPPSNPAPSLISTKNKHWMDDNAFLRAMYVCSEFTHGDLARGASHLHGEIAVTTVTNSFPLALKSTLDFGTICFCNVLLVN